MKYLKIILILLVPFLLGGCATVDYNLNIEKDLSVSENVFMSATDDYFLVFYKELPKTVIKRIYENDEYMSQLSNHGYTYEMVTKDVRYPGILAKKKYLSLTEYTNNTIFKSHVFDNVMSIQNNNLITIKMTNFIPFLEDVTEAEGYPLD